MKKLNKHQEVLKEKIKDIVDEELLEICDCIPNITEEQKQSIKKILLKAEIDVLFYLVNSPNYEVCFIRRILK
jgi:hypothetical protein